MTQILVLQWSGSEMSDFDRLVLMEDALDSRLGEQHEVDGHDFGAGEMNIFVHTTDARAAFAAAGSILGSRPEWTTVRAAFRNEDQETFEVLWPPDVSTFEVA